MTYNHWYRLCVDVDHQGHPIGASYERHLADDIERVGVMVDPGPFDTIAEVLEDVIAAVVSREGQQLALFRGEPWA